MSVSNVSSTNDANASTNQQVDPNLEAYENLSNIWSTYSNNTDLSEEFKKKINEALAELGDLIDTEEEEKKNEEIAKLITSLTAVMDGNDKMISIADRVAYLKVLKESENLKEDETSDTYSEIYNNIYNKLNAINSTYANTEAFYKDLCTGILKRYEGVIAISIPTMDNYTSLNNFYKDVLENQKDNIKKNDLESMQITIDSATGYGSVKDFFDALVHSLVSYTVYQSEEAKILASSRSNLSNNTLSLKVIQASNAYKMLELDNYMSEELNKRAEMDPSMKRFRDGNYWGDNNQINANEDVKKEDELWTKKQE